MELFLIQTKTETVHSLQKLESIESSNAGMKVFHSWPRHKKPFSHAHQTMPTELEVLAANQMEAASFHLTQQLNSQLSFLIFNDYDNKFVDIFKIDIEFIQLFEQN